MMGMGGPSEYEGKNCDDDGSNQNIRVMKAAPIFSIISHMVTPWVHCQIYSPVHVTFSIVLYLTGIRKFMIDEQLSWKQEKDFFYLASNIKLVSI